jgi:hypothetical protein
MFGIRTGETKTADAITLLASHPLTHHFTLLGASKTFYLLRNKPLGQVGTGISLVATPNGLVDVVLVAADNSPKHDPTTWSDFVAEPVIAGDIISQFGGPNFMNNPSFPDDPLLTYTDMGLVVRIQHMKSLEVGNPVTGLMLFTIHACPPNPTRVSYVPWHGFASSLVYSYTADWVEVPKGGAYSNLLAGTRFPCR